MLYREVKADSIIHLTGRFSLCGNVSLCVSVMTFSASLMSYVIQHWRRLLTCNREELGWCGCPHHARKWMWLYITGGWTYYGASIHIAISQPSLQKFCLNVYQSDCYTSKYKLCLCARTYVYVCVRACCKSSSKKWLSLSIIWSAYTVCLFVVCHSASE